MDIALNNGYLLSSKGQFEEMNLGLTDGIIETISSKSLQAKKIYDLDGLFVAPGLIDVHIHEDSINESDGRLTSPFDVASALLRMGVTSAIGGNCGSNYNSLVTIKDFIQRKGYPINFSLFLGYNSFREMLGIGPYQEARGEEITKLQSLLIEGMEMGALGLSLGIAYHPGISFQEMEVMATTIAGYNGFLSIHTIGNPKKTVEYLKELIHLSQKTGVKIQVSHVGSAAAYGQMDLFLEILEEAIERGVPIRGDCYPYDAFCTAIGTAVFDEGFEERLNCTVADLEVIEGEYEGKRCDEKLFHKLQREDPMTYVVCHAMEEEEVIQAIQHPYIMVASDTGIHNGRSHPRTAGTFPRLLGHYCRDRGLLSLEKGLSKATLEPAKWFHLSKRGLLEEGYNADLFIFNRETIIDCSTYSDPLVDPSGIQCTIVAGRIVMEENTIKEFNRGSWLV